MKKMGDAGRPSRTYALASQIVVWAVLAWMGLSSLAQKLAERVDLDSEEGSSTLETAVIAAGFLALAVFVVGVVVVATKGYASKITAP